MTVLLLAAAALLLIAALAGSRDGRLGGRARRDRHPHRVRMAARRPLGDVVRDNYDTLLGGRWGLYLAGGGLIIALLSLLVPKERPTV